MAGDWIKMRCDLRDHPKVVRLAEKLGQPELFAIGALWAFWRWVDVYAVDGHVDGATASMIDRATGVPGLADALCVIRWLHIDENGVSIPDFEEHNGETSRDRMLKNQRQARWRERKAAGLIGESKSSTGIDVTSTHTSTSASTREEKRREEKKDQELYPPAGAGGLSNGHDLLGQPTQVNGRKRNPPVPFAEIVAIYHATLCPPLPMVEDLGSRREGQIRARWQNQDHLPDLDSWQNFFDYVKANPFLMGKRPGSNGRKPFIANLLWLTNETNFLKIAEGHYDG